MTTSGLAWMEADGWMEVNSMPQILGNVIIRVQGILSKCKGYLSRAGVVQYRAHTGLMPQHGVVLTSPHGGSESKFIFPCCLVRHGACNIHICGNGSMA